MRKLYHSIRFIIRKIQYYFYLFFVGKSGVICNICGWKDIKFLSDQWHPYTICPKCGSQVRQRLFWAIIMGAAEYTESFFKEKKVLHFAPEKKLSDTIKSLCRDYQTADIMAEGYLYAHIDYKLDISNILQIKNNSFDILIAFDVLEHIPDHLKAMSECHRIIKQGAYCFFTVPQKDNLEITLNGSHISDPEIRNEMFGKFDHYRIYGNDFKQMLESIGFEVFEYSADNVKPDLVKKHVLFPPVLSCHPLATNYRRIFFCQKK